MKKILICAPTASAKNYCAQEWLLALDKLTYPSFEVVVFDNSPDAIENAEWLNSLARDLCVKYDFTAIPMDFSSKKFKQSGLLEKLAESHNACREYAIANGYSRMLHLETDVMPEPDVIERLLAHNKQVVGALYYRDEGISRKLMVQQHVFRGPNNILSMNLAPDGDVCFIDGTLKKVSHVGLGCVLIHTSVFFNIDFRFHKGSSAAPDTYFAEDCFRYNIDIYADTSLICEHRNQAWGNYGIDFN